MWLHKKASCPTFYPSLSAQQFPGLLGPMDHSLYINYFFSLIQLCYFYYSQFMQCLILIYLYIFFCHCINTINIKVLKKCLLYTSLCFYIYAIYAKVLKKIHSNICMADAEQGCAAINW